MLPYNFPTKIRPSGTKLPQNFWYVSTDTSQKLLKTLTLGSIEFWKTKLYGNTVSNDSAIIIEYFNDGFTALLESVKSVIDRKLNPIVDDMTQLKADVKVIKAAVTATNHDVQDLKKRVAVLEAA